MRAGAGIPAPATDPKQVEALARFDILRPFLQDGVPLPRIAHEQDLSPRTLER